MKPTAHITQEVIDLLGLDCEADTPIYLGESNIKHMEETHPKDYETYFKHINEILSAPDYVGMNPSDQSIEYVREYRNGTADYVKVAVRIAKSGRYYARSLYVLNKRRAENFIRKGTLKRLTDRET